MMFSHEFKLITCCHGTCGITFAVPNWWEQGKRQTHSDFYCPNGHIQSFSGESDLEKVQRERDIARQQVARAEQESVEANARAALAQKQKRRLEKRASAGACPCCQRSFSNMANHMRNKHPEFVAENVVQLKKKA